MTADDLDIRLTRESLDAAAAVARVSCPEAGGIALFLGITRAEIAPPEKAGQTEESLRSLEYHAYEEMALQHLRQIAAAAAGRWPICRLVLWHRLGDVPVGQPSVLIAVATPHRGEAFDACENLIDELKKSVPIWKREMYCQTARWHGA
jgi:molybdopterin synthase catalytic subunit